MKTIKERISYFIEKERVEKLKFYKEIGMVASNFSGKALLSEIGGSKISKILIVYPHLNARWLLTGEGKMTELLSDDTTQTKDDQAGYGTVYEKLKEENEELKTKYISCLEEKDKLRVSLEKIYLNEPVKEPAQ